MADRTPNPAPKEPGAKHRKTGDLADAHFRIDDMERRFQDVPTTEHIAGVAAGVAHTAGQAVIEEISKLRRAQDEDVKTDLEVVQGLRELIKELKGIAATLREMLPKVASGRPRD